MGDPFDDAFISLVISDHFKDAHGRAAAPGNNDDLGVDSQALGHGTLANGSQRCPKAGETRINQINISLVIHDPFTELQNGRSSVRPIQPVHCGIATVLKVTVREAGHVPSTILYVTPSITRPVLPFSHIPL